jgi:hypothetical protein
MTSAVLLVGQMRCPLGCPHPIFGVLSAAVSAPVRTTTADTSFTQLRGMSAAVSAPVRTQIVRLSVRSRVLERLEGGHGAVNSSISITKTNPMAGETYDLA